MGHHYKVKKCVAVESRCVRVPYHTGGEQSADCANVVLPRNALPTHSLTYPPQRSTRAGKSADPCVRNQWGTEWDVDQRHPSIGTQCAYETVTDGGDDKRLHRDICDE